MKIRKKLQEEVIKKLINLKKKNYYEILKILRENNINSEIFLDSKKNLGKQLTYANKRECPVAIICGENEFKENTVTLKNLLGIKGDDNQKTVKKENPRVIVGHDYRSYSKIFDFIYKIDEISLKKKKKVNLKIIKEVLGG